MFDTDKEVYICMDCYKVGALNEHGKCECCLSNAVLSTWKFNNDIMYTNSDKERTHDYKG